MQDEAVCEYTRERTHAWQAGRCGGSSGEARWVLCAQSGQCGVKSMGVGHRGVGAPAVADGLQW